MTSEDLTSCLVNSSILVQVGVILVFATLLGFIARKAVGKLRDFQSTPDWLKTLADTFHKPIAWLIWGYGLLIALEVFARTQEGLLKGPFIVQLRRALIVVILSYIIFSWKESFQVTAKKKFPRQKYKKEDVSLIEALSKLFSVLIVVVTTLIVLDIFGVQLTALYAAGGIGGVAVGFAAKDVVANFFGGLMIYINRPFAEGDWIRSTNQNFEGVVEQIGWYMTRIRTFTRRPLFIPNSVITSAIIENPGRMYHRRIKEEIPIRYQDISKISLIVDDVREMLHAHPEIDQNQLLLVHFIGYGPNNLILQIYAFTKTTNWEKWLDVQQEILIETAHIAKKHKANITPAENKYY